MKNKRMEKLVGRFLDGATTIAEERELYDFFADGDVPEHLEPYREMFAWFDGGLAGEARRPVTVSRPRRGFVKAALSAAAVVALVLLLRPEPEPETYIEMYMIQNGVKITDPAIVRPALEASQAVLDEQIKIHEEMVRRMEFEMAIMNLLT
jgi:hypothetical protein